MLSQEKILTVKHLLGPVGSGWEIGRSRIRFLSQLAVLLRHSIPQIVLQQTIAWGYLARVSECGDVALQWFRPNSPIAFLAGMLINATAPNGVS